MQVESSCDPELESAGFQPLKLKYDILVSSLSCFSKFDLYRYIAAGGAFALDVAHAFSLTVTRWPDSLRLLLYEKGAVMDTFIAAVPVAVGLDTTFHSRYCCASKHIQSMTASIAVPHHLHFSPWRVACCTYAHTGSIVHDTNLPPGSECAPPRRCPARAPTSRSPTPPRASTSSRPTPRSPRRGWEPPAAARARARAVGRRTLHQVHPWLESARFQVISRFQSFAFQIQLASLQSGGGATPRGAGSIAGSDQQYVGGSLFGGAVQAESS